MQDVRNPCGIKVIPAVTAAVLFKKFLRDIFLFILCRLSADSYRLVS